jgi:CheY-like chemotaxis protein
MTHSKRILLVEDNEDLATLLSETLADSGHTVRTAFDGLSALEIATSFDAQLAILDLGIPGIDGIELARRLGELPGRVAPRLIALSGYDELGDRELARQAGFEKYFVKPFLPEALEKAVAELEEVRS